MVSQTITQPRYHQMNTIQQSTFLPKTLWLFFNGKEKNSFDIVCTQYLISNLVFFHEMGQEELQHVVSIQLSGVDQRMHHDFFC